MIREVQLVGLVDTIGFISYDALGSYSQGQYAGAAFDVAGAAVGTVVSFVAGAAAVSYGAGPILVFGTGVAVGLATDYSVSAIKNWYYKED